MPNNFIMTNNTSDNRWDLTYNVDASGTKATVINANGTFVDRPIKVAITTPGGIVTPAINNTNLSTYFNSGSSSNYSIILQPTYTNTAGYIAAHTGTAGNGTSSYYSIKTTTRTAGAGSVTLTAGSGNVTLTVGTGDSGSSSATSMSMATTTPSSGVYYTLTAKGKGTVTGTGKGTVSTGTGWITEGSTTSNDSASASQTSNEATTYGYIMKSVYGDAISGSQPSSLTRTSGTYVDVEIQPYGYIKIPAGYFPLDRYIFANKANASNEATAASNYSLAVSSISGSSDVTVGTLSSGKYPIIANNVSVTATLTAGTAGWFSSGSATDSDTDSVTVGKMPAAVIGSEGSVTTAPSVTIGGTTNMDTTNSGTYYFTRTGTANNGTVQTKYKVTTAGYTPIKTATNDGTVTVTPTKTSDATIYIPTAVGSIIMTAGSGVCTYDSTNSANVTISDTNTSGVAVVFKGKGSVEATAAITTAGYTPINNSFATGSSTSSNETSLTKYITGVELTAGKTFSITVPNGNSTDKITFVFTVDSNYNVTVDGG